MSEFNPSHTPQSSTYASPKHVPVQSASGPTTNSQSLEFDETNDISFSSKYISDLVFVCSFVFQYILL